VLRPAEISLPWRSNLLPVFGDREQAERTNCRLICQSDGAPIEWQADLQAGKVLATVWRTVAPSAHPLTPQTPINSPLRSWASEHYMIAGTTLLGQLAPSDDNRWPDIVIGATPTAAR
jgi:hypothetical protein